MCFILGVIFVFSRLLIRSSSIADTVVKPQVENLTWTSQTFIIPTGMLFSNLDSATSSTSRRSYLFSRQSIFLNCMFINCRKSIFLR